MDVAKKQNARGQLNGDVEVDAHGLRSYHISTRNTAYSKYVTPALQKRKCKYYLNYKRVLGLRKRGGGKVFIRFLPPHLVPPRSTPPPESAQEVKSSGILRHAKPGACVVHSDGAQAYPAVIKAAYPRLKHRAVSHKEMEFVKKVARVTLPSGKKSAASTGTQAIDSTWKTLEQCVPKEVHTKSGHTENRLLEDYAYSWLFRINHRCHDGFQVLGEFAAKKRP